MVTHFTLKVLIFHSVSVSLSTFKGIFFTAVSVIPQKYIFALHRTDQNNSECNFSWKLEIEHKQTEHVQNQVLQT